MALINPVYTLFVPFLFVVTIPLALFAGLTTLLAFSVLIFRVAIVYLDIAISLVPQSIVGFKPRRYRPPPQQIRSLQQQYQQHQQQGRYLAPKQSSSAVSLQSAVPSPTLTPGRRRRRRPSSASIVSNGSTTPVGDASLGLFPSLGPERDFEGIGGWRVGGDDDIWTTINSRLEFPDRRHHHRSPSGGAAVTTPGEGGYLMMKGRNSSPEAKAKTAVSPNSSRARTPTGSRIAFANSDSYFPLTLSPKAVKKSASAAD